MWYHLNNINDFDTPALVVYKERAGLNIDRAIAAIGDVNRLRPHVKTHKIAEVCRMMMDRGISKFKCATIAEAEMLANVGAKDVLLAYQPVGPKAQRFLHLTQKYSATTFSCIADDMRVVKYLSEIFGAAGIQANIYADINTGMNRTGVAISEASGFVDELIRMPSIHLAGIHAYDGHIKDDDLLLRQTRSDLAFEALRKVIAQAELTIGRKLPIVAGGSPSFLTHIKRDVECSPGTFVFWDWGYHEHYSNEPYDFAALVVTRVISIVDKNTITTDLGYKSVASENPLPRVRFLNVNDAVPISHSEEHMCIQVPDTSIFRVGDVLYGVPVHICPTVALYDLALVAEEGNIKDRWSVTARGRSIIV